MCFDFTALFIYNLKVVCSNVTQDQIACAQFGFLSIQWQIFLF